MNPNEEVLYGLSGQLEFVREWFVSFSPILGALLVAAAAIWTIAIAWRKFKETTNKV